MYLGKVGEESDEDGEHSDENNGNILKPAQSLSITGILTG